MNTDYFSIDYSELDTAVERLLPQNEIPGFSEIITGFLSGKIPFGELFSSLASSGYQGLLYGFFGVKEPLNILITDILDIIPTFWEFYILSKTGKQGQAAQTGFFVAYLLIVAGTFQIYEVSRMIVSETLSALIDFMKVLLPVLF